MPTIRFSPYRGSLSVGSPWKRPSSSGCSIRVRGAEKHEIYAVAFDGPFLWLIFTGPGGHGPLSPPGSATALLDRDTLPWTENSRKEHGTRLPDGKWHHTEIPPMDRHTPVKAITLPQTSFPGGKYEINFKHSNLTMAGTNFIHSVFDRLFIH